jgi:hypothetical protein
MLEIVLIGFGFACFYFFYPRRKEPRKFRKGEQVLDNAALGLLAGRLKEKN